MALDVVKLLFNPICLNPICPKCSARNAQGAVGGPLLIDCPKKYCKPLQLCIFLTNRSVARHP